MLRAQVMPLWPKPFNQMLQGLLKAVPTLVDDPCQFHGSCFSLLACMKWSRSRVMGRTIPPAWGLLHPALNLAVNGNESPWASAPSSLGNTYCCFPLKEIGSATLQRASFFGTLFSTIGEKSAQAQSRALLVVIEIDPTHPKGSSTTFRGPSQGNASTSYPPTRWEFIV